MFRSIFTVSGFTLLSRVLGFARDVLIAKYLGAGATADIWVAAFRFPNLFRRIFGEGAFNAAFVPMYSGRIEEKGEAEADSFARKTISLMFVILLVIFVLAFIFMEPIVRGNDGRLCARRATGTGGWQPRGLLLAISFLSASSLRSAESSTVDAYLERRPLLTSC